MNVRSELRPHILIDGKRTVEVDYFGLHAVMLYAGKGQAILKLPFAALEGRLIRMTVDSC